VTKKLAFVLKNHEAGGTTKGSTKLPSGWVELQLHVRTGSSPLTEVFLDGSTTAFMSSTAALGSSQITSVQIGHRGSTKGFDAAFDAVTFDTTFVAGGGGGGGETAPATPTNLHEVSHGTSTISIAWNAVANADTYGIYRDGSMIDEVTGTSFDDSGLSDDTLYSYRVDAANTVGRSTPTGPLQITTDASGGGGTTGTVVMAAGDIACDPNDPNYDGNKAKYCQHRETATLLEDADVVLALGDTQYYCGGPDAYAQSYDPTWGRYKAKTYAVPADQEYATAADEPDGTDCSNRADAAGYYDYFGARGGANGAVPGVYSVDVDGWHVVGLNSVCTAVGGCKHGDPMDDWLQQDLANSDADCTIAMLHVPRFVSLKKGPKTNGKMAQLWETMYAGGVDIVLSGNSHVYERFVPQDVDGNADNHGVVEMIVGTGGRGHGGLADPGDRFANSAAGQATSFGVMELTLHDGSYDFSFLTAPGEPAYADSGSSSCTNTGH
jgi:hypothetical protein